MANGFSLPGPAVLDVGQYVSAGDINTIRDAAMYLDGISIRDRVAFDYSADEREATYADPTGRGDVIVWRGSFEMQSGMTTLEVAGNLTRYSTETLEITLNNTSVATVTASGAWTRSISITSVPINSIAVVYIWKRGLITGNGLYNITRADVGPVVLTDGYPATVAFTDGRYTSGVNSLRARADWLFRRLSAVPQIAGVAMWERPTLAKIGNLTLYQGTLLKQHSNDVWRYGGTYRAPLQTTSHLDIVLNGSVIRTIGPVAAGSLTPFFFAASLGAFAIGDRIPIAIRERITAGSTTSTQNNRLTLDTNRVEAGAGGYGAATPPPEFIGFELLPPATTNSRLTTLSTMLDTAQGRVAALGMTRVPLFRWRYGSVNKFGQDQDYVKPKVRAWHPHRIDKRLGDRLVVRGQDVTLCWGTRANKADATGNRTYEECTFQYREQLIPDGVVETRTIFLDQYPELLMGQTYYLDGDVQYAAEYIQ